MRLNKNESPAAHLDEPTPNICIAAGEKKTDKNVITIVRFLLLTFFFFFANIPLVFDVNGTQVLFLILSKKSSASSKRRPMEKSSPRISGDCRIEILCRVRLLPQWPLSELCSLTSSLISSLVFAFYVYLSSSPAVQHVVR